MDYEKEIEKLKSYKKISTCVPDDLFSLAITLKSFGVNCSVFFAYGEENDCILKIYEGIFEDSLKNNFDYLMLVANNILVTYENQVSKDHYLRQAIVDSLDNLNTRFKNISFTLSVGSHDTR